MNPENIRNIIALAVLILMSGYFSATETAFLSCNKTRAPHDGGEGKQESRACQQAERKL